MSRSSSGSGLRTGRLGAGCDEPDDGVPEAGELLGPLTGQECGDVDVAGVCGAGGADCEPGCTVRTGSPACGRAELVVPPPGRPSVGAGTGAVSSVAEGGTGAAPDCPFEDPWGAPCPVTAGCPTGWPGA
jgi:hypothetical protein